MEAYSANQQESAETALDNNNVAAAVMALMLAEGVWRGTAADLIRPCERGSRPSLSPPRPSHASSALLAVNCTASSAAAPSGITTEGE